MKFMQTQHMHWKSNRKYIGTGYILHRKGVHKYTRRDHLYSYINCIYVERISTSEIELSGFR